MDIVSILLRHPDWLIGLVLICVGFYFGRRAERKHLASLAHDEAAYQHIRVSSERFYTPMASTAPELLTGSVVIAQDRFKMTAAWVLSLFGKNLTVYESLLERARREAVVRVKRAAASAGCTALYGLRFEMTEVSGGVEVLAYATGVRV